MSKSQILKLLENYYKIPLDNLDPYCHYDLVGTEKGYFFKVHRFPEPHSSEALLSIELKYRRKDCEMYEDGFQVIHAFCFSDGIQLYKYRPEHNPDIHTKMVGKNRKAIIPHRLAPSFIKAPKVDEKTLSKDTSL